MCRNKRTGILSALIVVLLLPGRAHSEISEAGDRVWDEVVSKASRGALVPRAAIVVTTGPGAGQETETWVTFRPGDAGGLRSSIVYRREGTRVLNSEERERRNEIDTRRRQAAPFRIDEIPIHPDLQSLVRYRRIGAAAGTTRFEFSMRREHHEIFGTVTVRNGGNAVQIDFEPRTLPLAIRSLRSTLRLKVENDGYRLDSMTVNGSVGALWMRRSFQSEYRFVEALPSGRTSMR